MLTAQTPEASYFNCLDYSRTQLKRFKGQSFYCPACHDRLRLKIGATVQPHFAHLPGATCHVAAEGETAEHLAGKALLGKLFRRWQINFAYEVYLASIQQRPDLLISKGAQRIAIEFQCSPISLARLRARTEGYRRIGYRVVWILGQRYQRQQWPASNHAFLQYSVTRGWYQWQLAVNSGQLWLLHHIAHHGYPQQVSYQRCLVTQKHLVPSTHMRLTTTVLLKENQRLNWQLGQAAPELRPLQQACYLAGHHLAGAPLCCHQTCMPPLNRQATLLLAVRLLLFCEQQGQVTVTQLQHFCWENRLAFYPLPLVDEHFWYVQWCGVLLKQWQRQNIVVRQGQVWFYLGACWYVDYYSKKNRIQAGSLK
ncbi:competence protein CoiA [Loigolactobacillus jiayinensis]|uniref:Competence protein CoiA n=1 Tax=Loigolactobacillus jiayinensis TaxID=2486016 RepID=A0ABW1RDA8_9LACO|nr:competence protein CoiA family protein [Loigolactobacillus jiayinensis]